MCRYREALKLNPQRYLLVKKKDAERKRVSRTLQKEKELALPKREQAKLTESRKMAERIRKSNEQ